VHAIFVRIKSCKQHLYVNKILYSKLGQNLTYVAKIALNSCMQSKLRTSFIAKFACVLHKPHNKHSNEQ
jgi:hypothetical protein